MKKGKKMVKAAKKSVKKASKTKMSSKGGQPRYRK